ncbi:class F sortase [Streptomyces sp. NPDC017936]|uniref:class F sortase n=1 Tax=Streptomyces sp. NPDC017936 TaxID=3365016 RepID=UPI0037A1F9EA
MAPRRRIRRPWYRTRAYRLTRTAVLAVTLVAAGVWCAQDEEPAGPATAGPAGSVGVSGSAVPEGAGRKEGGPAGASGEGSGTGLAVGAGAEVVAGGTGRPEAAREARPPRGAQTAARPSATRSSRTAPPGTSRSRTASASSTAPRVSPPRTPLRPSRPASSRHPRTGPARPGSESFRPLPRSRATRLVIPYLSIDAPVMDLRLDGERRLPAPPEDDPRLVGWYAAGPSPGEQGTAVAVGHLDTDTGPAVFAPLSELGRGRRVEVRRADGRVAVYTVDAIKTYEKEHFPDREVYGARGRPELRLITCGGAYDRRKGYTGNLVVFAHLAELRAPRPAR